MLRNCWDVKSCERFPGGDKVDERGPCRASTMITATGINNGLFGGRACWAIEKFQHSGELPEQRKKMPEKCLKCNFYFQVVEQEARYFQGFDEIKKILREYKLF